MPLVETDVTIKGPCGHDWPAVMVQRVWRGGSNFMQSTTPPNCPYCGLCPECREDHQGKDHYDASLR